MGSAVATCSTVSSVTIAKKEPESFPLSEMVSVLKLAVDKKNMLPETMVNFENAIRNAKGKRFQWFHFL